jgi:hypothetical protein
MNRSYFLLLAAALAGAAWIATHATVRVEAGSRQVHFSVRGEADSCAGLRVDTTGQVARAEESFTAPKGAALEINASERGNIRVIGSARSDFRVQACKIAVGDNRAEAEGKLGRIAVGHSGARFTSSGPSEGEWLVYFIVHAPKEAALDLETRNGPITVEGVEGKIRTRAGNGPISLDECSGDVQARVSNGPISFTGNSGNVSLATQNGPVTLHLTGDEWKGPLLEARTVNGPLSLHLPETYRSGVQVDTAGHAPFACRSELCRQARTDARNGHRSIRLNRATPVVRLSTEHGPVAVNSERRGPRTI